MSWLPFRSEVQQDQRKPVKFFPHMRKKRMARDFAVDLDVQLRKGLAQFSQHRD